jgi:ABC-type dipeptide/oligopeptide/nickel transport system ATPase component
MLLDGVPMAPANLRGSACGLVFQDSRASLDPLRTVVAQVRHAASLAGDAAPDVRAILLRAGFPADERWGWRYPHELSGGMAQRAAIACALARKSPFLLCDEPTTGLDAEVQADIVEELRRLASGPDAHGILFVTHDLDLLDGFADRILVMEGGRIVEQAERVSSLSGPGAALVQAMNRLREAAT